MRILEAILSGEHDPEALARLCSTRIKASRQTVAKSLHGNWREELLFALRVALDSYRFAQSKIAECDERIGQHLAQFEDRAALDTPPASSQRVLWALPKPSLPWPDHFARLVYRMLRYGRHYAKKAWPNPI